MVDRGCCGSVAGHWRLKPEVSWVQLSAAAGLFSLSSIFASGYGYSTAVNQQLQFSALVQLHSHSSLLFQLVVCWVFHEFVGYV